MPPLTGGALRAARIGNPVWGKRGYDRAEVDAFLARAAEALDALAAGRAPAVTADEVHSVIFHKPRLGRGRGYDEDQVDALLDGLEDALRGTGGIGQGVPELNGQPLRE